MRQNHEWLGLRGDAQVHKLIGFADGENLVLRYQDMIGCGKTANTSVVHIPDVLAWHPNITLENFCDTGRISYYQTIPGDDQKFDAANQAISDIGYKYKMLTGASNRTGQGALMPRLFKKTAKNAKTKSVDINIAVDFLRQTYSDNYEILFLLSGDGDYLPLLEEAGRKGKQVWVAAFSKGLSKSIRFAADEFFDLDKHFFKTEA